MRIKLIFSITLISFFFNLSAQNCDILLGVWQSQNGEFHEFRTDGRVYILPDGGHIANWECPTPEGKLKLLWGPGPAEYTIDAASKSFSDGSYTWKKEEGEIGEINWVVANGTIPGNAVTEGSYPICKCEVDSETYAGNYVNGKCNIVVDEQSRSLSACKILVRTRGIKIEWVQSDGWKYPSGLVTGSSHNRYVFNVGAILKDGKMYPGEISFQGGGPNITASINGQVVKTTDFKWLSATLVPYQKDGKKPESGIDLMDIKSKEKKNSTIGTGKNN